MPAEPLQHPGRTAFHKELVRILLRIPGVTNPNWRDQVFDRLTPGGTRLVADRFPAPADDLLSMVAASAEYQDGLNRLVDEFSFGRETSTPALAAHAWLARHRPEALYTAEELDELLALLKETSVGMLRLQALATRRLPASDTRPLGDGTRHLVERLADAPVIPGEPHALLAFVEAVAVAEAEPIRRRLRRWSEDTAMRVNVHPALLVRVRNEEEARQGRHAQEIRLLVEVHSHPAAPASCDVRAWLLVDHEGSSDPVHAMDRIDRDQLPRAVEAAHTEAVRRLGARGADLRVDFVLPRHLLWLPVDQWRIKPPGAISRKLGAHRQVVVRSRERYLYDWHPRVVERWNRLLDVGWDPERAIEWIGDSFSVDAGALWDRLRNNLESPYCFVVFAPPEDKGEDEDDDFVSVLLELGIPVIIAVRDTEPTERARHAVSRLLGGEIRELPERVRVLRVGARGGAEPADPDGLENLSRTFAKTGLHERITLVWGNPDGMYAAEDLLRPPQTRGSSAV
ncbi:hypothetical protein [Streptomyces sp. NBC_00102]|uniref:VMAP-C domain-containing protein n=1 Tax=Streptomyces sp. NBC_00102 TaxID=2975652 RepID=UPI002257D45F|nr:hypothetical protein [Streptomyces sp. NBC_00102]MCX5400543.1 hypothetical protein [Streptomyces sp. NBC_00102]